MRNAYLNTLFELAKNDKRVLSLVADNGLIVYDDFRINFPEQYFNFGISESNMVAAAAGMASCGKIPFVYTISSFLAYRAFEFIRDDVCMQNMNVKIIGIGSGMAYSTLGPSHHTTEDISVLRALPKLTLFSPGCPEDVRNMIQYCYENNGPVYIRLGTNNEPEIYHKDYHFEMGKGVTLQEGSDITLIATGAIVHEVIQVAQKLQNEGLTVRVVNIHTLKPFDKDIVEKAALETNAIFSIEEHNVFGGLGTLIEEAFIDRKVMPHIFHKIGLNDCFAEGYGSHQDVRKMNGLDTESIFDFIFKCIGKG